MHSFAEIIQADETAYNNALLSAAEEFASCEGLRAVLITGGSCSGKTTTTIKLRGVFNTLGLTAHHISLDDFFRNADESAYLPDGQRDTETVASLRTDLIYEKLSSLMCFKKTQMPIFDFKISHRNDEAYVAEPQKGDIFLIEGLHAHNPELFGSFFSGVKVKKLYLYADSGNGLDCRFIRRLVRDSRHRNHFAEDTLAFWARVRDNENKAIIPYKAFADREINTFFRYESNILNDDAAALLAAVGRDSRFYSVAQQIISVLPLAEHIPDELVPPDSLLREFM